MTLVFHNTVLTGFNPDPSIARVGPDFFLTTSTFEYFPGLPIYHSRDLLNWKHIGHALTRRSQLDMRTVESGAGIWAPTLRWRKDQGGKNGRFYVTTCNWSRYRPQTDERIFPRGFYVYTDDIWNSDAWSEPVYFDNAGFDQDVSSRDGFCGSCLTPIALLG
jgi:beta-xylosidase